ncbi:23991_t:CDS:1 [Dentiscutata erythropus]|uniref:23991_t:CDS:1 n=1 Tax=Dentiscutata erythropus TaxID=1348616 RepID=A0A9N9ES73_9GLOM|nr:23991_t:CDS:1 [Dentiscutata erythropus]
MANLIADTLREIFEYHKDDPQTLYNLITVNRLWCCQAIPLLWRRPFEMTTQDRYHLIIRTYVMCLSDKALSRFMFVGIKLDDFKKPFFNYPTYLQNFDSERFRLALNIWIRMNVIIGTGINRRNPLNTFCKPLKKIFGPIMKDCYKISPPNLFYKALNKCIEPFIQDYYATHPNFSVIKEVTDLVFSRCNRLKNLKVYFGDEHTLSSAEMNFALLTIKHNSLLNLQKFELVIRTPSLSIDNLQNMNNALTNLFTMMSKYATKIQEMKIQSYATNLPIKVHASLYRLIESQRTLQSFMSNYFWDASNPSIFTALLNQSHSLTRLCLWGLTHFDNSLVLGLLEWNALEVLELMGCPDFPVFADFTKGQLSIRNLYIGNGYCSYPFITTNLIRMINLNLQKLVVEGATPEIIDAVTMNCPQLTHLSLCAYQEILESLPRLLSTLSLLETLILGNREQFIFTDDTILRFSQSIPSSLCALFLNFNLSSQSLRVLLTECSAPLHKLELHQIQNKESELFSILIQYTKNNNYLKELKLYLSPSTSYTNPVNLDVLENAKRYFTIVKQDTTKHSYNLW